MNCVESGVGNFDCDVLGVDMKVFGLSFGFSSMWVCNYYIVDDWCLIFFRKVVYFVVGSGLWMEWFLRSWIRWSFLKVIY